MSLDLKRKNAKTQTAYSFCYCKHCEHLKIIRMQNLKQQFQEIRFIMNINVMMAQADIFIHLCAVVLLVFAKTVIACSRIVKKGGAIRKKIGTLLVSS